jgi:hypothetical protein
MTAQEPWKAVQGGSIRKKGGSTCGRARDHGAWGLYTCRYVLYICIHTYIRVDIYVYTCKNYTIYNEYMSIYIHTSMRR